MAILGNRRDGNPIILNPDGSTNKIRRVSFTENMFQEGWLQDLIEDNPELSDSPLKQLLFVNLSSYQSPFSSFHQCVNGIFIMILKALIYNNNTVRLRNLILKNPQI